MQTRSRTRVREEAPHRTTSGRVRVVLRPATPPLPWEPLVPVLLSLMLDAVRERRRADWRDSVGFFLDACMLLCRESRRQVMDDTAAKYLLFYEMWRRAPPKDAHVSFLDMWPAFVPLTGPFEGTAVSDRRAVRRLDVRAAVADRASCVSTLEVDTTNLDAVRTRFYAPDLPPNLPVSVNIFVGRARFIFRAIREDFEANRDIFDAERVAPCRVCGRDCFFREPPAASDESDEDEQMMIPPPLGTVESQHEYWRMCGGRQPKLLLHETRCCSSGCRRAMQTEVNIAMGITSDELLQFDAPHHKEGTGRVPAALRAALKRNELTARRMRATADHFYRVLTCEEVGQFRSVATTMMNVDLALLYAAACIAESPAMIAGRVLPPLTRDWRSVPTICRSATVACRQLYNAYRPTGMTPVANVHVRPRFLSKSRDLAGTFF